MTSELPVTDFFSPNRMVVYQTTRSIPFNDNSKFCLPSATEMERDLAARAAEDAVALCEHSAQAEYDADPRRNTDVETALNITFWHMIATAEMDGSKIPAAFGDVMARERYTASAKTDRRWHRRARFMVAGALLVMGVTAAGTGIVGYRLGQHNTAAQAHKTGPTEAPALK